MRQSSPPTPDFYYEEHEEHEGTKEGGRACSDCWSPSPAHSESRGIFSQRRKVRKDFKNKGKDESKRIQFDFYFQGLDGSTRVILFRCPFPIPSLRTWRLGENLLLPFLLFGMSAGRPDQLSEQAQEGKREKEWKK